MEIESKGVSRAKAIEVSLYHNFDRIYKQQLPVEAIPNILMGFYSSQEGMSQKNVIIYRALVDTYFQKWKEMNGL